MSACLLPLEPPRSSLSSEANNSFIISVPGSVLKWMRPCLCRACGGISNALPQALDQHKCRPTCPRAEKAFWRVPTSQIWCLGSPFRVWGSVLASFRRWGTLDAMFKDLSPWMSHMVSSHPAIYAFHTYWTPAQLPGWRNGPRSGSPLRLPECKCGPTTYKAHDLRGQHPSKPQIPQVRWRNDWTYLRELKRLNEHTKGLAK